VRKAGRTTLAPHANWQGDYEIGTTADGTPTSSCNGATNCPVIQWPGSVENADGLIVSHAVINTWWGSLINEKTDASGLRYMRNRYYNPRTGQFTQQDPIGLAGGLNLYGFADGDPVNFTDPFGVCIGAASIVCQQWIQRGVAAVSRYANQRIADLRAPCDMACGTEMAVAMAMGMSGGLSVAGAEAGGIGKIVTTLSRRFGDETAAFTRPNGAVQREWVNSKSGMKHVLRGPETSQIQPGAGPVKHWNYEQQAPQGNGRYKKVQNVHLDENGNPIK
jgi:RHS repeat-associated protein